MGVRGWPQEVGPLRPAKLVAPGDLGIFADLAARKCGIGEEGARQRELFREF